MEGKIIMSTKELARIKLLQKIVDREISQIDASKILGISYRQVKRLVKRVREGGLKNIVHRNLGKPSTRKINPAIKEEVLKLYPKFVKICKKTSKKTRTST